MFFEKNFFFFYAFLGSKRIEQMRLGGSKGTGYCVGGGGSEKGADAFEGARDWSGNELPTERWRRAKRQLCLGKGAGAANCSGKPGARRLRRARARKKAKQKCIRELQQLPIGPELIILLQGENYVENI